MRYFRNITNPSLARGERGNELDLEPARSFQLLDLDLGLYSMLLHLNCKVPPPRLELALSVLVLEADDRPAPVHPPEVPSTTLVLSDPSL